VEAGGNYSDALRIQPYLGRFFHASDEHGANSAPYIVLSYAYWHSHFHDDRGAVGRIAQLNKHPFTILGVAPPKFRGTIVFVSPNFVVSIADHEQVDGANDLNDRGSRWLLMAVGHLKAGVTPAQATADLNSIASYLEKTYPKDERQTSFLLGRPGLFGDQFGPPVQAFLAANPGNPPRRRIPPSRKEGRPEAGPERPVKSAIRFSVSGFSQRHVHQMLAQEPYLQLVGAQDVADRQIVGAVVAQFISQLREFTARPNDDLVGVE
jgi:hypothetical protein